MGITGVIERLCCLLFSGGDEIKENPGLSSRKRMAAPLTTVLVVCLVTGIVLLAAKNKSLKASLEISREMSEKSLDEKTVLLTSCQKDLESKSSQVGELEKHKNEMDENNNKLNVELSSLRVAVAEKKDLEDRVKVLSANSITQNEKADQMKKDLEASQQKASAAEIEKSNLQARVNELQQKASFEEKEKNNLQAQVNELQQKLSAAETAIKSAAAAAAAKPQEAKQPEPAAAKPQGSQPIVAAPPANPEPVAAVPAVKS